MRLSKGKERQKHPEARPASRWPRLALLVAAGVAAVLALVWFLTQEDPRQLARQGEALLDKDPKQAGELLERAVSAAGGDFPEAQVLWCEALGRQERWLEARGCLSLIKDKSGCDGARLLLLAQEAYKAREFSLAFDALAAAEAAGAPEADLLRTTIPLSLAVRREDEALASSHRLAKLAPDDPLPHAAKARILRRRVEVLPAIEAYRAALQRAGGDENATALRRELVELLIQTKNGAEARRELDLLLRATAATNDTALLRGNVLRLEGRGEEALEEIAEHLARNPDDASGLYLRGTVWFDLDENEKAAQDLTRVVKLNPNQKEAHYKLGQSLSRLGRESQAREHLEISARLAAQTVEILELEKELAKDPRNESLRARLDELYKAVGITRSEP